MTKKSLWHIVIIFAVLFGAATTATSAERPKIGVTFPTLTNPFWGTQKAFLERGAEVLGMDVIVVNADDKPDSMIKGLEDLVAQGVDGIIHIPYWNTAGRAVTLAEEAGIPIVLVNDPLDNYKPQTRYSQYIAFVGPSDEDAGYQMGTALFAAMKPAADGKKYIAAINGTAGTSVAIGRRNGLERALKEHPEVVLAGEVNSNFLRDVAMSRFESLYQGHPEITGVWAANDESAIGAINVFRNSGKKPGEDVFIAGMDLDPEAVALIKKGEQLFSIGGHWMQGGFGLVILYDHINGFTVPADKSFVQLKLLPLTKDLISQYERDFPGGVPEYDFRARSKVLNPNAQEASFEMKYSNSK